MTEQFGGMRDVAPRGPSPNRAAINYETAPNLGPGAPTRKLYGAWHKWASLQFAGKRNSMRVHAAATAATQATQAGAGPVSAANAAQDAAYRVNV
jgi:hypothetical protein